MAAQPTIGFITTSFPRYVGDPAGSFVFDMAASFIERGYKVEVVAPEPSCIPDWHKPDRWPDGITVHAAPYFRPRRFQRLFYYGGAPDNMSQAPWRLLQAPSSMLSLGRMAQKRVSNWNGIISHWLLPSGIIGGLMDSGLPHLSISHSADMHLLKQLPLQRGIASWLLGAVSKMGFVSKQLQGEFESILPDPILKKNAHKLVLAPMGVYPDTLISQKGKNQVRAELGIDGFCSLFIGRLVEIKGLDVLMKALSGLPGHRLVVAGDGPLRQKMQALAAKCQVEVLFTGTVGLEKKRDLLKACDALVVPSRTLSNGRHEGLPMVVLEGLAARIPVVVTDCGGAVELIRDGRSGLIVTQDSSASIRNAITRLEKSPTLASRLISGGDVAVQRKNWHFLAKMYETLLFN